MATLFNTKIKDTYQSLLKLEDNTILTTTVKNVTDGLGNASPLYMSTTGIGIGTNAPSGVLHITSTEGMAGNNGGQIALSQAGASPAVIGIQGSGWNTFGIWGISRFTTTAVPDLRIFASGIVSVYNNSLLVGAITTSTAKFQVRGGGSSSATTALLVDNSSGTAALTVKDDLSSTFGGNINYKGNLTPLSTSSAYSVGLSSTSTGGRITAYTNNGASPMQYINFGFNTTSLVSSGGFSDPTHNGVGFALTNSIAYSGAGGGTYTSFLLNPTLNFAGNPNAGIYRAIYYNPTLTNLTNATHIAFENTTGNVLLGTTSGFVGIGTSNPTSKLEVIGATRISSTLNVGGDGSTGSSYSSGFIAYDTGNGYAHSLIHAQAAQLFLFANPQGFAIAGYEPASSGLSASNLAFMTSSNTRMKILSNGNVLIGTTTDSGYKLDVRGGTAFMNRGIFGLSSTGGQSLRVVASTGGADNVFSVHNEGSSIEYFSITSNAGRVRFDSNWQIGNQLAANNQSLFINTDQATAAFSTLTVRAGNASSGNRGGGNLILSSGASAGSGDGINGYITFNITNTTAASNVTNSTSEVARFSLAKNLLIGTSTDNGYKLNVNGTAFVSELITTGGMVKLNPYTVGVRALEIYTGIGHLGNTGVWASMYTTGVYGNGFDGYIGTQGYGVIGDPNNNSNAGSVVNIGVSGGATLSNATGVYGTSGLFGKATNFRNASAALEVNSTTHGFLPPRMTAAQRSALTTITGFGTITGGSGYVDGTYYGVSITGGSGQNAYARIVVSGGSVTIVELESGYLGGLSGGFGYTNGASVSASNTQLGGSGAGFSVIINASTPVGMMVYQTDATEGLYIYKSTGWTFIA